MLFQRLDQQTFGILGRTAFIADRHICDRNIDFRRRFLGNFDIGSKAKSAEDKQRQNNRARAVERRLDHRIHDVGSINTRTMSPASTKA